MKFTDIILNTLTEEVKNKRLFSALMDNWRTEKPNITEKEGEELFNGFAKIQGNLKPELPQVYTFLSRYDGQHGYQLFRPEFIRDITKYSYNQLKFLLSQYSREGAPERAVDVFGGKDTAPTPERIDASKNLWFGDENLIINKDGLRVYDVKDQQMSIRYGYYYHTLYKIATGNPEQSDRTIQPWCVTWRPDMGKSNMWGNYRTQGRSFYFVIDENKSTTNRYYMSALQIVPNTRTGFILTSMMNDGDNSMGWDEIVAIYPQLNGEKEILVAKPFSQDELTMKDVVGQINETPGNRYEFKRMERDLKKAFIQNGGVLHKSESWKSMDTELRNLYILYPNLDRNSVRERFNNFDFVNEIRKVGNEFNLLDRHLKNRGMKDGVGEIFDYLMSNEFKIARVSSDNKKIRLYESKVNGKSGLYDISKNSWVEKDGITYEPLYSQIDIDTYSDENGDFYVVEIYSKSPTPTEDSFYSIYLFGDENPEFDSHFLSSKKWRELVKELSPEDGSEPKTDKPKDYTDINEKRG